MTTKKLLALYALVALLAIGLVLAAYVLIGIVAVHFMMKFW
jgi:hypothetical protein